MSRSEQAVMGGIMCAVALFSTLLWFMTHAALQWAYGPDFWLFLNIFLVILGIIYIIRSSLPPQ